MNNKRPPGEIKKKIKTPLIQTDPSTKGYSRWGLILWVFNLKWMHGNKTWTIPLFVFVGGFGFVGEIWRGN